MGHRDRKIPAHPYILVTKNRHRVCNIFIAAAIREVLLPGCFPAAHKPCLVQPVNGSFIGPKGGAVGSGGIIVNQQGGFTGIITGLYLCNFIPEI